MTLVNAGSYDSEPFGTFAPTNPLRSIIAMTRAMPDVWLPKRTALALRNIALRSMDGRPVDVETLGVRMRLFPYNNICEKRILFTPQYFDVKEREILASRLKGDCTFIDIGANVGAYSLFVAAQAGPRARILAIEPQPDIFERLVANIRFNPFGTIKAIACALADKSGELTLFLDYENRGESSVKIVGSENTTAIRVPAKTLLELLREEGFEHLDAAKLDVEGAEDLIMEPFLDQAPASLFPKLLIIEDGEGRWHTDLPKRLISKGYRFVMRTRLNLIFER
ncbi:MULTISPECIES: FkbM family methyltransferase [unclassified Chelatococcus]|uniref:FkbM family methyltransferase n=1 Tax=unclassified Chelatococcus TaxID=2638111 RepID=UPI001BCC3BB6|nr:MULTISPECIES: FkbM family methyltransferase [unclassified Chelatococcus]MBS7698095.1 FkbM family methyltransferase [Chelatococcus sp. YT9]MBX3556587.1 FkbM family methyltransferase [Chelatococcus sp.]